jgi:predicted aspartyl protease
MLSGWRPLVVLALLAALGLAGTPATGGAPLYRWTTESGEVHYTQGLESIPERYRGGARVVGHPERPEAKPASAATSTPAGGTRISFTPGRPIYVMARINGGGTAELLLDTGASVTVINPWVLQALGVSSRGARRGILRGVTGTTDAFIVRVDSIEVGGARHGPVEVVSHDAELGHGDGLLGRDFLDRFHLTIDSEAGIVTLTPR